jgi:hypothetical protein
VLAQRAVSLPLVEPIVRSSTRCTASATLFLLTEESQMPSLYAVGSPQSREGDERNEKKLDLILRKLDPEKADGEIEKLDRDYART